MFYRYYFKIQGVLSMREEQTKTIVKPMMEQEKRKCDENI